MIWVSYQIGCQLDEPCGFSGDHWQMHQCFNVFTDIYKVFFLVLFHCCILLEIKRITATITCHMFGDRVAVAWILPRFCRQAGGEHGTTMKEKACFIFDIIKSSQVKMIQYSDELNQKRVACRQNLVTYVSAVKTAQLRS